MSSQGTIAIGGSVAQKPRQAGHTWQFLQYMLGFRELGWDVLLIDRLEEAMCRDANDNPCACLDSENVRYLVEVMRDFGLEGSYSLLLDDGEVIGVPRRELIERVRSSAVLINFMGFIEDEEVLSAAPRRVFLDTDPGFGQMWRDLGWADLFSGHDVHLTIAERIHEADCEIPACGIDWRTMHQPVSLSAWPAIDGSPDGPFTTIGSWRGPYDPIEYRGKRYGLRVHEFRKFVDVPSRVEPDFEVALDIDTAEAEEVENLEAGGWRVADPRPVGDTPASYREYLQRSAGEFMVAKGIYVDSRSGWFSERSINYLASGRPVLAQDTALADLYPIGEGLLTYTTPDDAVEGVNEIMSDYERHASAARAIAEEFFDSRRVLPRMLSEMGVG